jgi:signal transduction histidine kinase
MLHDLVRTNRAELISRARRKGLTRAWPPPSPGELENGIPLFMDQLSETLRLEATRTPFSAGAMDASAERHGRDLLERGFTVSQVVHDYGDVCQAITEMAMEGSSDISAAEFHTLNRCLDDAIAAALTAYGRLKEEASAHLEVERMGRLAHELRNRLQTALLSFGALKAGTVGVAGATGATLGRSLVGLSEIIDSALAEVRLASAPARLERVSLLRFIDDVAIAAHLHADYRDIRFTVEAIDPGLGIEVDAHLLTSALMNLLQNAFKYSRRNGSVTIRARAEGDRILIDVEDECGGLQGSDAELFRPFGERSAKDASGLGLGLSISRKAVEANRGEIHHRNLAGKGCIFTIDLPQAAAIQEVRQRSPA